MSNEITKRAPLQAVQRSANIGAIIPQSIEEAYRIAQFVTAANTAPKTYGRDANTVMVGIMHGLEVGLTPMAALQSIAVINGMPTIYGDGALGLVRSSSLLEDIKEEISGEGDSMVATCTCKRIGQETPIVSTFSVADAKEAGLWKKAGPWTQYPKRMLQMRARSWALRDGFADVLRGLYIREEAEDIVLPRGEYQASAERPRRSDYDAAVRQADADAARMAEEFRGVMAAELASAEIEGLEPEEAGAAEQGRVTVEAKSPSVDASPAPETEGADTSGELPPLTDEQLEIWDRFMVRLAKSTSEKNLSQWSIQPKTKADVEKLPEDWQAAYTLKLLDALKRLGGDAALEGRDE